MSCGTRATTRPRITSRGSWRADSQEAADGDPTPCAAHESAWVAAGEPSTPGTPTTVRPTASHGALAAWEGGQSLPDDGPSYRTTYSRRTFTRQRSKHGKNTALHRLASYHDRRRTGRAHSAGWVRLGWSTSGRGAQLWPLRGRLCDPTMRAPPWDTPCCTLPCTATSFATLSIRWSTGTTLALRSPLSPPTKEREPSCPDSSFRRATPLTPTRRITSCTAQRTWTACGNG